MHEGKFNKITIPCFIGQNVGGSWNENVKMHEKQYAEK